MIIRRENLSSLKEFTAILRRKITWLCIRIKSFIRINMGKNTSIFDDLEMHLLDKILISKYALTKELYIRLKKSYKQIIKDFNTNGNKMIYVFTLKRLMHDIKES